MKFVVSVNILLKDGVELRTNGCGGFRTRVIFNVNGEIKTLNWNSDKGQKMFADFPAICMGVYDSRCNREWILEDLK